MIEIIHKLRAVSGTNAKLEILKQESDNENWKEYLMWVYNESINYYNSPPADLTFKDFVDTSDMFYVLGEFSRGEHTGNAGRDSNLRCSKLFGELWRLALGRSIKAGISITTINKAYPGLIPTFDVMLAKDVPVTKFPVLASTKFDGVRVVAFVRPEGVELKTRAGKIFIINSLVDSLSKFDYGVYDGELVSGDGLQEGRTTITGQVNKCLKGTAKDIDNYSFCIFDYISLKRWKNRSTKSYLNRMNSLYDNYIPCENVTIVRQILVNNQKSISTMFAEKLNRGYEGLILRYPEDPYEWKRTDKLIKKKATRECVLQCIGVVEGAGKYEGLIGALICEGYIGLYPIHVKLGTGFSDHDRERNPEDFMNKDIEVMYNDITIAKKAVNFSLFLPRFKRIVGDRNV